MTIALALTLPAAGSVAAQTPTYSRATPTLARPAGLPNPASRVRRLTGNESMALRVPGSGAYADDYLYRRAQDGTYVAITAPGYAIVNSTCSSSGAIDTRARMIDLAAAEWAWFGFPTLDLTRGDAMVVPATDALPLIDQRANVAMGPRVLRRALRLGLMEDDAAVRPTIAGYWAVTGSDEALRIQHAVNHADPAAGWSQPWSAAFVSWLACEAGLSPQQFRRSGRHFDYVRAAVAARDGQDPAHAFIAYDLHEVKPSPGDLICAARAGSGFTSLADIRAAGADESTALHCELVVKTDPVQRRLLAVGGNVAHAVTLSAVETTTDGRPVRDADLMGASRWFAVLKFRGVPDPARDLDCTPTVLGLSEGYAAYAAAVGTAIPASGQTPAARQAGGCRR